MKPVTCWSVTGSENDSFDGSSLPMAQYIRTATIGLLTNTILRRFGSRCRTTRNGNCQSVRLSRSSLEIISDNEALVRQITTGMKRLEAQVAHSLCTAGTLTQFGKLKRANRGRRSSVGRAADSQCN